MANMITQWLRYTSPFMHHLLDTYDDTIHPFPLSKHMAFIVLPNETMCHSSYVQ